jgi:beta-galactosidase
MVETGLSFVRIGEFAWSRIEPSAGNYQFEWLDEAIGTLADAGLKIILCTPTATPPKWLVDTMPDMLAADARGRPRMFGSRRHYDFAHEGYRKECARIVTKLAGRYGDHPAIVSWQTDNEYGCHDTVTSYGAVSRDAFRQWLAKRYASVAELNEAWGNVFWSKEYTSFDEVELPNLTVTEPNPAHMLAYRRFASDMVVEFNRVQTEILRQHAPGRDLVHNYMGRTLTFDHHDVSADLDVASWDSYPLGFLEQFGRDAAWKRWYVRAGDPDFQAFHHDLYRGMTGRWSVMEQQPGPVNWAPWNPAPEDGMVRAWTHEAIAHGAEYVSYFRWRQAPFGQEQFHAGMNRPDNSPDLAIGEAAQVARELADLPEAKTARADVALIVDYPSFWSMEAQSQGEDYDAFSLTMRLYSMLRMAGQNVDVISAHADLSGYKLVVVPNLPIVPGGFAERAIASGAELLFAPRCGSRTAEHRIPDNLGPGPLADLLGVKVLRVESMQPAIWRNLDGGVFERWFEFLDVIDAKVIEKSDGHPAITRKGRATYLAGWPDEAIARREVDAALERAGLTVLETGDDLRLRDRGNLRTIINYGPGERDCGHLLGKGDTVLVGGRNVPAAGITIVERKS